MATGDLINYGSPHLCWDDSGRFLVQIGCEQDVDKTEFLISPDEFPNFFTNGYKGIGSILLPDGVQGITTSTLITRHGDILYLNCEVKNTSTESVSVAYCRLPLLMNQAFRNGEEYIFTQNVIRNSCLIGEGAYITWTRLCGQAPMLVLLAQPGTSLRYFHVDKNCNIQQMHISFEGMYSLELLPAETILAPGETYTFLFSLFFLMDDSQLPSALVQRGGLSIDVFPSMVAPEGEDVTLTIKSGRGAYEIVTQSGDTVTQLAECSYRPLFHGYGQRTISLNWDNGRKTDIQFFATEAVRKIYKKTAGFIAKNHLETDPEDPCYHGILAWDLQNRRRVNAAFNPYDDWMRGGSDEIGLVGGLYLAEKNVYMPCDEEIEVLDKFDRDFIIDRLTEQPGWRVHRMVPWYEMFEPWSGYGADDVWRAYNYVHVVNFYYAMYRISERNAHHNLRSPSEYLELAYHYAIAMFSYWMFPEGKGATHYCNMGESTFALEIEDTLRSQGLDKEVDKLKGYIDAKCKTLSERLYPFASEMAFDTTAFEAAYAYGLCDKNIDLMNRVNMANLSTRGRHPVWHKYYVDIRQQGDSAWNVSYMTQLGAWPFMDRLLRGKSQDVKLAIAAYASYLAGFSIYNAGGCWYPEPENEGAMLWVFDERMLQYNEKNRMTMRMSGEGPLGFYGALKAAAAYRIDHPEKGEAGLGCNIVVEGDTRHIVPTDGVGARYIDLIDTLALEVMDGCIDEIHLEDDVCMVTIHPVEKKQRSVMVHYRGNKKLVYGGPNMDLEFIRKDEDWMYYILNIVSLDN